MQIITIEDQDFPDLLELFNQSERIGEFTREGKLQFVHANKRLVMISPANKAEAIAIRPVRGQHEAKEIAFELLERAGEQGISAD